MKKSKKIMLCLAQCAIIALFIILAAGSTDEQMVSTSKGINQGNYCLSQGYTFVGYFNNADCKTACSNKGYNYYCTGENTVWCGCK